MLTKIGSAEVNATLIKAAEAIRDLNADNERLRAEIDEYVRKGHAEKIASSAVERGIMDVEEADEYARGLASGSTDLDMVEEFVSRTVAGVPLGSAVKTASADVSEVDSDVLTSFLLTNEI